MRTALEGGEGGELDAGGKGGLVEQTTEERVVSYSRVGGL